MLNIVNRLRLAYLRATRLRDKDIHWAVLNLFESETYKISPYNDGVFMREGRIVYINYYTINLMENFATICPGLKMITCLKNRRRKRKQSFEDYYRENFIPQPVVFELED